MSAAVSVKVTATNRSTTLTQASEQWRNRPADQRYDSIEALAQATASHRAASRQAHGKLSGMRVKTTSTGELALVGQSGAEAVPNHWAFGQLCRTIKAPADYLRSLPTDLAATNLNHGLAARKNEDESESSLLLSTRSSGPHTLAALTSKEYKRIWNDEVVKSLVNLQERAPSWQFPQPFRTVGGSAVNHGRGATQKSVPTAFASDHDMFVFLCDYDHPVSIAGNPMARGFFAEQTEVGDGCFVLTMFLFDFVCSNIMVWGARNVTEIRVRHTGKARDRVLDWDGDVLRAIGKYGNQSARLQEQQFASATTKLLGANKVEVVTCLREKTKLAKGAIEAAYTVAEQTPRYGDPRSVWGMVSGLTEVSQRSGHMDTRAEIDREAGKILSFAF